MQRRAGLIAVAGGLALWLFSGPSASTQSLAPDRPVQRVDGTLPGWISDATGRRDTVTSPPALQDLEAAERRVTELWGKTPLQPQRFLFVTEKPTVYGDYVERKSSVFAPGEVLITYVEPVGYSWKEGPGDHYLFGLTVDFEIRSPEGKLLATQENFGDFSFVSYHKVTEEMVSLSLTLTDFPPGDYVLTYIMHDRYSDKTGRFSQPFSIRRQT